MIIPVKASSYPLTLDVAREETEKQLHVEGKLSTWLQGVLVRNSSIPIYQEGKQILNLMVLLCHMALLSMREKFFTQIDFLNLNNMS